MTPLQKKKEIIKRLESANEELIDALYETIYDFDYPGESYGAIKSVVQSDLITNVEKANAGIKKRAA